MSGDEQGHTSEAHVRTDPACVEHDGHTPSASRGIVCRACALAADVCPCSSPASTHPTSAHADQPLTGDELATIKTRAEAATRDHDTAHLKQPWTTLRLVAEIERLRAQVERLEDIITEQQRA